MTLLMLFFILYFFLILVRPICFFFFFFNDTATTEIYTLSLHDALPISPVVLYVDEFQNFMFEGFQTLLSEARKFGLGLVLRSEEHTSELQSHLNLVCRLLLEKKKKRNLLVYA